MARNSRERQKAHWSEKMRSLWWSFYEKRAKKLHCVNLSPLQLRKLAQRRRKRNKELVENILKLEPKP